LSDWLKREEKCLYIDGRGGRGEGSEFLFKLVAEHVIKLKFGDTIHRFSLTTLITSLIAEN